MFLSILSIAISLIYENTKMQKSIKYLLIICLLPLTSIFSQPWVEESSIFNPSGVPSLSFSQPRFYDFDADGDFEMILGSIEQNPIYFKNIGNKYNAKFEADPFVFQEVRDLDAEMGVCADMDNDGDLDFVSGGYTGLHYYQNTGNNTDAYFVEIENVFANVVAGENPSPALGDLDGDGDFDLVFGLSEDGRVKYIPNTGNSTAPQFLEANSAIWFDVGLFAYPVLFDLDGDKLTDLLIGKDGHGFDFYQNTGDSSNFVWTNKSSLFQNVGTDTYWNSPSLVDLTGDGRIDLLYGTASGPIKFYKNTGTNAAPIWAENTTLFGGTIDIGGASSPVLFDFDSDGDFDLFSGSQMGDIKYFENTGNKSSPAWLEKSSIFSSIDHSIYSAVTVGDLNNDGIPELIVGDLSGNIYAHKKSGTYYPTIPNLLNEFNFGGWSVPRLIDFDFDNDLDLIVGNENGDLAYLENSGTPDSAAWTKIDDFFGNLNGESNCVPYPVDYDSDGDYDLFLGNIWSEMNYYENNDNSFTLNNSAIEGILVGQNAAPALADLDNDGDLDIIVGNYGGTFNYYTNMSTVDVKELNSKIPNSFELFQNYPNPFNPSTTIKYSIPNNERNEMPNVKLIAFDILGNEVATLVNENQIAGNYSVNFDASNLASGIYLYKLQSGSFIQTKKLMLLK